MGRRFYLYPKDYKQKLSKNLSNALYESESEIFRYEVRSAALQLAAREKILIGTTSGYIKDHIRNIEDRP